MDAWVIVGFTALSLIIAALIASVVWMGVSYKEKPGDVSVRVVRAATTDNTTLSSPTVDGVPLRRGDLVLLTGQNEAGTNGIYEYNGVQFHRYRHQPEEGDMVLVLEGDTMHEAMVQYTEGHYAVAPRERTSHTVFIDAAPLVHHVDSQLYTRVASVSYRGSRLAPMMLRGVHVSGEGDHYAVRVEDDQGNVLVDDNKLLVQDYRDNATLDIYLRGEKAIESVQLEVA